MNTMLDSRRAGCASRTVAVAHRRGRPHLLEDLRRRQVALQPALARRAERARHPAAGLRRDADGVALRIAHQHRLEGRAVHRAPQHLARLPGVAFDLPHRVEQLREQVGAPARAPPRADRSSGADRRSAGRSTGWPAAYREMRAAQAPRRRQRARPRRDRRGGAAAMHVGEDRKPGAGMWASDVSLTPAASARSSRRRPTAASRRSGPSFPRDRVGACPCP